MKRMWHIERDESGMPSKMWWLGDIPDQPKPPCAFNFKTRGGAEYRCKLTEDHNGPHKFID